MAEAASSELPDHVQDRTLEIDFSWRKNKARVTEEVNGERRTVYVADFHTFKSPSIEFKDAEETTTWGTGTLHAVRIHADCTFYDRDIRVQPLSRLKTSYMHMSKEYSNSDAPVEMEWKTTAGLKDWNFICVGPDQVAVAKFSAHVWATKKFATLTFSGTRSMQSERARQEILVTGLTLYSQMLLRTNNFMNLFGSAISRPDKEVRELKEASAAGSTSVNKTV